MELSADVTAKGTARQLTEQNSSVRGIAWATHGRSVIYGIGGAIAGTYLWRVSLSGGEPERLELAGDRAVSPAVAAVVPCSRTRDPPGV